MSQPISPEAQQAFKLDYAEKALRLLEAHAKIARLEDELRRLQARDRSAESPDGTKGVAP